MSFYISAVQDLSSSSSSL